MSGAQAGPKAMAGMRESTAMPRIDERSGTSKAAQPRVSVQAAMGMNESASAVFDHMARDKHFTPRSMLVAEPVAQLESMPVADAAKSLVHRVGKLGDLNPKTKQPETPLHIYNRADAYANVLEVIRGEFTRRLLRLLPSAPDVDGTA